MPEQQHPLERRAQLLGQRLKQRVDTMAMLMRPDGRALFHERKSEAEAMRFWRRHRYDEMGQAVLSTWTPQQILQLDQRLMQANEEGGAGLG